MRTIRLLTALGLALVAVAASMHQASAQQAAGPGENPSAGAAASEGAPMPGGTGPGGEGPVEIFSDDTLEWLRDEKVYVARGNALVRRGGSEVTADTLVAYYREDPEGRTDIYKVAAEGGVVVRSGTETATGSSGVYHLTERVAVLTGDGLSFVTPTDVVTACDSLEYYETARLAVARGDVVVLRPEDEIRADAVFAFLEEDAEGQLDVRRIDGYGNVTIITPGDVVFGDRAVYDLGRELAVVSGDVRINQGENQLKGAQAEVNLRTNVSRLFSGVTGSGDAVRAQALIVEEDAAAGPGARTDEEAALPYPPVGDCPDGVARAQVDRPAPAAAGDSNEAAAAALESAGDAGLPVGQAGVPGSGRP